MKTGVRTNLRLSHEGELVMKTGFDLYIYIYIFWRIEQVVAYNLYPVLIALVLD
jgi:hypothetical protein